MKRKKILTCSFRRERKKTLGQYMIVFSSGIVHIVLLHAIVLCFC